jgi:hypothetical protein
MTLAACRTKAKPTKTVSLAKTETHALMAQHAANEREWQGIINVQLLSAALPQLRAMLILHHLAELYTFVQVQINIMPMIC